MEFSFNQLSDQIYKSVNKLGYSVPTEIQNKAIPFLINSDADFVGQAQTGTGKTAAFCLPLLEKLDFSQKGVQAVILSPTRELANQINEELIKFGSNTPLKTTTVYGGVGYREQLVGIHNSHIVIATPGRAIDLLTRGKLKLDSCQYFIIDEADEMLKMGFIDDVDQLLGSLPENASKWMFSATMPKEIIKLMKSKLSNPEIVRVKNKTLSSKNITQSYTYLQKKDFFKALKTILLTESEFYGIVFCETREETKSICERLLVIGEKAAALHGDLNQSQRDNAMALFKSRKINILVCTDVAARGVDVTNVTHVINMGLPRKLESYVHRIGRTGRAGNTGKAISFIAPKDSRSLKSIESLINDKLTKYNIPCSFTSKEKRINTELDKMNGLKNALIQRQENFEVDQSYDVFSNYFSELSKEQAMKLLFSYQFNRDLKEIDETISQLKQSEVSRSRKQNYSASDRSRNKRRRSRTRRY